jgi:RNA polymerase subunit RPABC4/transcription elongation factor Spt4
MNCPNCNFLVSAGRKFCPNCGERMRESLYGTIATTIPDLNLITDNHSEPLHTIEPEVVPFDTDVPELAQEPSAARVEHRPPAAPYQTPAAQPAHPAPYDSPRGIESVTVEKRGRGPLFIALGALALLLALGVFAVLAWSGGARGIAGGGPTPTAIVIDPAAVLERTRASVGNIRSVKYNAEAGFFGITSSGPEITSTRSISIEGEIAFPESYTLRSNASQLGEYIVIGDTTWSRRDQNPSWEEQESSSLSLGLINPLSLYSYLQYYQAGTPVQVGSEFKGNVTVHRIRFQVDTARMSAETNDLSLRDILSSSRVDVDVYVDDKGYLPASMVLSVESANNTGVLLRANFSDYNGPVSITAPVQ